MPEDKAPDLQHDFTFHRILADFDQQKRRFGVTFIMRNVDKGKVNASIAIHRGASKGIVVMGLRDLANKIEKEEWS